jgi:4-diphosphocytidyl-2-C-methyl-D-erythritol kinase
MMRLLSPAKVNLNLEVLQKRPDGYHEVQTLMHRIDLADEMEIERKEEGISLHLEGEEVPSGPDNLAWRAAQIFFLEAKIRAGVQIRLRKRIPVAAGLGGGSSNAATVLMGLRDLFQAEVDELSMMAWGAKIGADVPFFIFRKPAWARGKGEQLTAAKVSAGLHLLLLIPPFRISTAWAYAAYDQLGVDKSSPLLVQNSYGDLSALGRVLHNDLERPAIGKYPDIGKMKRELLAQGAAGALMSGSGPVLFGLFPGAEETRAAGKRLSLPPGWRTIAARGI